MTNVLESLKVQSRLREIAETDKQEATLGGTPSAKRIHPALVRSAREICNIAKDNNRSRHEFGLAMPNTFRPRNDLSLFGGTGAILDGTNIIEVVEFAMSNFSPIRRLATIHPMEYTLQATIPGVNDISVEATIIAPGGSIPITDADFDAYKAQARNFGIPRLAVSRALLEDSPRLAAAIVGIEAGRLARGQNRFFTNGAAAGGGPGGVVNTAPVGKTTASQTAFSTDDVIDMVAAVPSPYRESPNACFMMHSTVDAVCMKLKDGVGRYLWNEAGLDRWPRVLNDHMSPTIAAGSKPILFGDFSQFHVVDFGPIRMEVLFEARAEFFEVVFQGFAYCDAALLDPGTKPIVSLKMAP
jgi:HK97 family phage major capsid protein